MNATTKKLTSRELCEVLSSDSLGTTVRMRPDLSVRRVVRVVPAFFACLQLAPHPASGSSAFVVDTLASQLPAGRERRVGRKRHAVGIMVDPRNH